MRAHRRLAAAGAAIFGAAIAVGGSASAMPVPPPIHPTAIFVSTSNGGAVGVVFNGASKPVVNFFPTDPCKSANPPSNVTFNRVCLSTAATG